MARKTVSSNKTGIAKLPEDEPVLYWIQSEGGKTNYAGIAKRGRVQERLEDQCSEAVLQKKPALKGCLAIVDAIGILSARLVELPIRDSHARPVAQFPRLANAAGRFHL